MSRPTGDKPQGTAQVLMDRMARLASCLLDEPGAHANFPDPPSTYLRMAEGVKTPGGATWNYKKMGRVGWCVWELLEGLPAEESLRQVLTYFADEENYGQMRTEQGCNAPHDGMHVGATMLARLAALKFDNAELMKATGNWIRGYLAMCAACSHDGSRPAFPGFRVKSGTQPLSQVRDIVYATAIGAKVNLPRNLETDRFYIGAKLAIKLKEVGALPSVGSELPTLYLPMDLKRNRNGFVASIQRTKPGIIKAGEIVDWTAYRNGKLEFGRSWTQPAPTLDS